MPRTLTRYISFDTLRMRGRSAVTVVKLMMASNDISLTNQMLGQWKEENRPFQKSQRIGAAMYFLRVQISHLSEGLKIIEQIQSNESLMNCVESCDEQTRRSFKNLTDFTKSGPRHSDIERWVLRVRHNLTFHYDESGECISKAIRDRADRPEGRQSSITRGSSTHLWRFKIADDVVDSIVVRQIWKIPRDLDLRTEADKVLEFTDRIVLSFLDFSGEFIWRYCQ